MPRGDGTGPQGGQGNQRKKGMGGGGRGRGQGGRSPEQCVCPSCGATVNHERGVPCFEKKCPQCGTAMVGK